MSRYYTLLRIISGYLAAAYRQRIWHGTWRVGVSASSECSSVNLTVNRITPTHLDVTYRGPADVTFKAVKFGGIVITLENVAGKDADGANQRDSL